MSNKTFPTLKLANGVDMPVMGFGCADLHVGQILDKAVEVGLKAGYRFFDNAPFYKDESEIGAALKASGIKREELFISTKLPNDCHDYEQALKQFERSRKKLGVDYLDMYMIHFPCPQQGKYTQAWTALEKLYKEGLVRAIGVSNFSEAPLQKIFDICEIQPMVNEVELNPYFAQPELRKFCRDNKIQVIAWAPLGGTIYGIEEPEPGMFPEGDPIGEILAAVRVKNKGKKVLIKDQTIATIGHKHGKSTAQVILRWHIQSDIIPIPKSSKPVRLIENSAIFDFVLTDEEMSQINLLDHNSRLGPDPDTDPMHNCS